LKRSCYNIIVYISYLQIQAGVITLEMPAEPQGIKTPTVHILGEKLDRDVKVVYKLCL
jgi:hypothetical protein